MTPNPFKSKKEKIFENDECLKLYSKLARTILNTETNDATCVKHLVDVHKVRTLLGVEEAEPIFGKSDFSRFPKISRIFKILQILQTSLNFPNFS